jgi:hypothetical protein
MAMILQISLALANAPGFRGAVQCMPAAGQLPIPEAQALCGGHAALGGFIPVSDSKGRPYLSNISYLVQALRASWQIFPLASGRNCGSCVIDQRGKSSSEGPLCKLFCQGSISRQLCRGMLALGGRLRAFTFRIPDKGRMPLPIYLSDIFD